MTDFLSKVVQEVLPLPLQRTLVIFPTRRACQNFRDELTAEIHSASWLPRVVPIKELLDELTLYPVADDTTLLIELYKVYNEIQIESTGESETIDSFLNWGKQILDDFNEIDRQLVPAELLFERIIDIKLLDATFAPDSEEYNYIIEFWKQFSLETLTPLREEFLEYWEMLPGLYSAYKKHLVKSGIVYEGLAWRLAAESISSSTYFNQFDKVIFAGFYALTKTEDAIINYLEKQNKCLIYKDADSYYSVPKHQEAGRFFRKGKLSDETIPWTDSCLVSLNRTVSVCGVSGRSSMARELALTVHRELSNVSPEELKKAVVVLPDEALLFPFLDHCSRLGLSVNPSMGFPLTLHPLMPVLHYLKIVRGQLNESTGTWQLSEKATFILSHPVIKEMLSEDDKSQLKEITKGIKPNFTTGTFAKLICQLPGEVSAEENLVKKCILDFNIINERIPGGLQQSLLTAFETICNNIQHYKNELTIPAWWKLVLAELDATRVPFKVDNNDGIRVMGFLETRVLDYNYVFIASLNEGTLPGNNIPKSLIPYSLRKAYHLPCQEEQDAVTAYHFYRLLQRASVIHLFYNSEINDMGGGEKSRYLYQLHHELREQSPASVFTYHQIQNPPSPPAPTEITIPKNPEIISALKNKFVEGFAIDKNAGLSPTSVSSFINCSLQFYFDQIAGIRQEIINEKLDANAFGKVLHYAMQLIYAEKLNQEIDAAFLKSKLEEINTIVKISIAKEYNKNPLSGHDLLMEVVLNDLIKRIVLFDIENAPFLLIGLETKIRQTLNIEGIGTVFLKGILDRVDNFNNELRILDYKTGSDKVETTTDLDLIFSNPKYKVNLQLYLYAYLYKKQFPTENSKTGIFKLKQFENKIDFLEKGKLINDEQLLDVESGLKKSIAELFNPEIPFTQTGDVARCAYCNYNGICNRVV